MFANLSSRIVFIFVVFAKLNCGAADLCSSPPPAMNPHDCCDYPCLFDKSILVDCGLDPTVKDQYAPLSCDKLECLFKKENLIGDDQKINEEIAKAHIKKWTDSHSEWTDNNGEVPEKCLSNALSPWGPPDMCQVGKISLCITKVFLLSCPAKYWTSSEQCENLKTYMQQCVPS